MGEKRQRKSYTAQLKAKVELDWLKQIMDPQLSRSG
jgi:hypothetical protein